MLGSLHSPVGEAGGVRGGLTAQADYQDAVSIATGVMIKTVCNGTWSEDPPVDTRVSDPPVASL